MVVIENHCVGCTDLGLHCIGGGCPKRRVAVHYCAKCGFDIPNRKIHEVGGKEYCEDCYEEINEE